MKSFFSLCLVLAGVSAFAQSQYGSQTYVRRLIDCESISQRTQTCMTNLDSTSSVRLATQLSHDACIPGQSFQINGDAITVMKGCRAQFMAEGLTSFPQPNDEVLGNMVSYNVTCESISDRTATCSTPLNHIVRIVVGQQLSNHACIEGQSYKLLDNLIQVSNGCRAEFIVTGLQMQSQPMPVPQPQPLPPQQDPLACYANNAFGSYANGGGCNAFGCYFPGGDCNAFGCYYAGGSCDAFGCIRPAPKTNQACN